MIQIDMQMPERCGVCFAMHTDEIGLESWCGIDETARDLYTADINTKRPEWCPMKEQEAVEPIYDVLHGAYHCGNCKRRIILVESKGDRGRLENKYCFHCGRSVKWE